MPLRMHGGGGGLTNWTGGAGSDDIMSCGHGGGSGGEGKVYWIWDYFFEL